MKLVSIAAGSPTVAGLKKRKQMQSLKDKNILLIDPADETMYATHVVIRPDSAVISNRV